jgi:hypothetical protein
MMQGRTTLVHPSPLEGCNMRLELERGWLARVRPIATPA